MSEGSLSENEHFSADDEVQDCIDPVRVRGELNRILASRYFQTSQRGKEFLRYVVNQKIEGKGDQLKERLIGVQIFGRKPDYATGEDPVVRVKAGDVRRRLELYYAENEVGSEILIQIPLGSYVPVFRLRRIGEAVKMTGTENPWPPLTDDASGPERPLIGNPQISNVEGADPESDAPAVPSMGTASPSIIASRQPFREPSNHSEPDAGVNRNSVSQHPVFSRASIVSTLVCLGLLVYFGASYIHKRQAPPEQDFWLPASLSSKPVLLWLPKPILYRPSSALFDRYRKLHPDAFVTREERSDQILPLEPTDTITWSDIMPDHNSGPGIGGVVAAMNIDKLLTQRGIRFELRFGEEASYAEMRSSPVVIVGAINADWAPQLTSELRFVFDETPGGPGIREIGGAKRVWRTEVGGSDKRIVRDYGLITRQLSGKGGQFLVQVAGISHFGTEAASEMLVRESELAKVLRSESITLQNKNLQIVVSTDLTDRRTGPPHIVAISSW